MPRPAGTSCTAGAAIATVNTAAPTGNATTTLTMAGCGSLIIPQASGLVLCIVTGTIATSATTDGAKAAIAWAAGTVAPTNGAAAAGTIAGPTVQWASLVTSELSQPVAMHQTVSNLTLGTSYWFDLQFAAVTAGTATLTNVAVTLIEVG